MFPRAATAASPTSRTRALLAGLVALLAASAGCGPQPSPAEAPTESTARTPVQSVGPEVARLLPESAPVVLFVDGLEALARAIDRDGLAQGFPAIYALASDALRAQFGHDLLDLAALSEVGVDVAGAAGAAWLDPSMEDAAVFATVRDEGVLRAAIERTATQLGGSFEALADGGLLRVWGLPNGERAWFVLRAPWVFMVVTLRGDEVGEAHARRLLDSPERPLATSRAFVAAWEGLAARRGPEPRAGTLYFNAAAFARQEMAAMDQRQRDQPQDNYALRQLAEARARGVRADIDYWEEQVRTAREWEERQKRQREAERRLLRELILPFEGAALDVLFDDDGAYLSGFMCAAANTFATRLMRNSEATPPIVTSLDAMPALLVHAAMDREQLLYAIELFGALEDGGVEVLKGTLRDEAGLDLEQDVLSWLSGEVGAAMFVDAELALQGGRTEAAIDFTLVVGSTSPENAVAALKKVFANPLLVLLTRYDESARQWTIFVPTWKSMTLAVLERHVVLTTRAVAIDRLRAEEAGTPPEPALGASREELERAPTAGLMSYTMAPWFLVFGAVGSWGDLGDSAEPYPEVPLSSASQAKRAELDTLRQSFKAQQEAILAREREVFEQLQVLMGLTVWRGEVSRGGYNVKISWLLGTDRAAAAWGGMAEGFAELERLSTERSDLWGTHSQTLWDARDAYRQLREQDWQQAQRRGP